MRKSGHRPLGPRSRYDVVVLGSGPAGLLLAREIAANDLSVLVVSPRVRRGLSASYGLWRDEAAAGAILDCLEHTWPAATVRISDRRSHVLARPYARVDASKLQEKLRAQALARGARFLEDAADHLEHDDEGTTVKLEAGGEVTARLVVDATGHTTGFVERTRDSRPALQMAYGLFLEHARLPNDDGNALLMDLRTSSPGAHEQQPSLLYAVRSADGRALVEETSLVATPAVPEKVLAARLRQRMQSFGISGHEVGEEISCLPLGRPLPDENQRVLGFGAAGGLVHPVTGNMLGGMLTRAAPLARELARLFHDDVASARLGPAGWRALWPRERREARELQLFAMEVLRELDGDGLREFFDAYFAAAGAEWPALLSSSANAGEITAVMERVFKDFPFSLKVRTSLLLTLHHRRLVPQLARTLRSSATRHGAAPPSH